jgi:hypothetical protein
VTAGFGGFFAHGGAAIDECAMRAGGAGKHEARSRVFALAGFEHGALAVIVCSAAAAAIALGVGHPRSDFTWPWALIPLPGFVLGFWLAERFREWLRGRDGWRGRLALAADGMHVVREIYLRPSRHG